MRLQLPESRILFSKCPRLMGISSTFNFYQSIGTEELDPMIACLKNCIDWASLKCNNACSRKVSSLDAFLTWPLDSKVKTSLRSCFSTRRWLSGHGKYLLCEARQQYQMTVKCIRTLFLNIPKIRQLGIFRLSQLRSKLKVAVICVRISYIKNVCGIKLRMRFFSFF